VTFLLKIPCNFLHSEFSKPRDHVIEARDHIPQKFMFPVSVMHSSRHLGEYSGYTFFGRNGHWDSFVSLHQPRNDTSRAEARYIHIVAFQFIAQGICHEIVPQLSCAIDLAIRASTN
jgi:hypothetical protein